MIRLIWKLLHLQTCCFGWNGRKVGLSLLIWRICMEPIQHGNLEHGHYDPGFPGGSVEKNPPANEGDAGSIDGSGRSPEGNGNPLQYFCLGNLMNRGAWRAIVHGVTKSRTQLSTHACMHYDPALKVPQHAFCQTLLVELATCLLNSREVKTERNIPKFKAVISGHHDLWTLHLFDCCCCEHLAWFFSSYSAQAGYHCT